MGGSSSRGREQFAVHGREEQFAVRGVLEEQFAARGVRDAGRKTRAAGAW